MGEPFAFTSALIADPVWMALTNVDKGKDVVLTSLADNRP
jgi:hypothetical protein